jgi:hypothetical protein
VAMAVLLFLRSHRPSSLVPGSIAALADLGITHATVLGDGDMTAVLLDGWSFDPTRSGRTAADLIAGPDANYRMLRVVEIPRIRRPQK